MGNVICHLTSEGGVLTNTTLTSCIEYFRVLQSMENTIIIIRSNKLRICSLFKCNACTKKRNLVIIL